MDGRPFRSGAVEARPRPRIWLLTTSSSKHMLAGQPHTNGRRMARLRFSVRIRFGAVVVAGILLASPTAIAATESPGADESPVPLPWSLSAEQEQQLAVFEEQAMAAGALGFYRDEQNGTLVAVVPAANLDNFDVAALGPISVPFAVKVSDLDPAALNAARDKIHSLAEDQLARQSMGVFFNAQTEKLQVTTTLDEPTLSKALGESWSLIDYHHDSVEAAGRFTDASPFRGGAALDYDGDGAYDCTSGFGVVNGSGQRGLVTAAHCAPLGWEAKTPTGAVVGTNSRHACGPSPYNSDAMVITGKNYNNSIYVGTSTAGYAITVIEAGNPAVGATYNYSGATSLERFNQEVLALDGEYWADNNCGTYWVMNLIVWHTKGTSSCAVRGGDSGGPFYFKQTTSPEKARIRGIVNAHSTSECYGMKYSKISSLLGYSIYL